MKYIFVVGKFYNLIPTSWDVVIIDSKTPSHSQAEELKADPFGVRVDQNNCSSCIGATTTAAQYMHLETMVQNFCLPTLYGRMLRVGERVQFLL